MKFLKLGSFLQKVAPLILALLLQFAPMLRVAQSILPAASPVAVILQWAVTAIALAGASHAVSGATTYISGLQRYQANLVTTVGPLTNNAVGTNGLPFVFKIIAGGNLGTDTQSDYFFCVPLPPGLTLFTNLGGDGFITNRPSAPGTYSVRVSAGNTNCSGCIVSSNLTITIYTNATFPGFLSMPTNFTGNVGGFASNSVTASGTAPFSYQWRLRGTNLPLATNAILSLALTDTNQTGPVTVVVTNTSGSVTSIVASLTVSNSLVGVTIPSPPTNVSLLVGNSTTMIVGAAGTAPYTYQWRKNGSDLNGKNGPTLALSTVTTNDAGDYTVVVSNTVNSATSSPPARLSVIPVPQLTITRSGPTQVNLDFDQFTGAAYTLEFEDLLSPTGWATWSNFPSVGVITHQSAVAPMTNGPTRFFRGKVAIP